jgi:hypothetical protein
MAASHAESERHALAEPGRDGAAAAANLAAEVEMGKVMNKVLVAFLLGLVAFPVMMFLGETFGLVVAFSSLAAYFFICQVLLSRGNPDALRNDWRIMLALDAVIFTTIVIMVLVEKRQTVFAQAPGMLLACCGGTFAGAFVASWAARRAAART